MSVLTFLAKKRWGKTEKLQLFLFCHVFVSFSFLFSQFPTIFWCSFLLFLLFFSKAIVCNFQRVLWPRLIEQPARCRDIPLSVVVGWALSLHPGSALHFIPIHMCRELHMEEVASMYVNTECKNVEVWTFFSASDTEKPLWMNATYSMIWYSLNTSMRLLLILHQNCNLVLGAGIHYCGYFTGYRKIRHWVIQHAWRRCFACIIS